MVGTVNFQKLFLKANDIESCDVVSTLLQDSIFHISALSFHENKKCLRLMLNRFCWELLENNSDDTKRQRYYRVHSGLYIHNIESITVNDNFKNIKTEHYLNLLSMHSLKSEINILFSDHKNVCVNVKSLCIYLKDLHDKYPSPVAPKHD
jgi:hypothetical protein